MKAIAIHEDNFVVKTFAGSGNPGHRDGDLAEAEFHIPSSIIVDRDQNVFVADNWNFCVRKISLEDNAVYTIAGTDTKGFRDGTEDAQFVDPRSLTRTNAGDILVADTSSHRVRAVPHGTRTIQTVAGVGQCGLRDGLVSEAAFACPSGLAVDANDNIIVSDSLNHCIRIINAGHVWTIAGHGKSGYQDGAAEQAQFSGPRGVVVNAAGDIFVADCDNHCIRCIEADTRTVSTVAGSGQPGWRDGAVTDAEFNAPTDIAIDKHGCIYVADSLNHCIRRIDPAKRTVRTIAGCGTPGFVDGRSREAKFCNPVSVDVRTDGTIFVADLENNVIRVIVIAEDNEEQVIISSRELHELRQKLREKEDSKLCKVCYDRPRQCSFSPCGHVVCCVQCTKRVKECPVCCKPIKKSNRVYEA